MNYKQFFLSKKNLDLVLKNLPQIICLAFILILAIKLRVDGTFVSDNMGQHFYYESLNIAEGYRLPLAGIHISFGGFIGPLSYYIGAIPLIFVKSVYAMSFFIALLNLFAIILSYVLVKRYFGSTAALTSSFLITVSSSAVFFSKRIHNTSLMPFFIVLLLYTLLRVIVDKDSKNLVLAAVASAVLIQLHLYGAIFIILTIMLLLIFRPPVNHRHVIAAIIVFIFLHTPLLLFEVSHGFENTSAVYNGLTHTTKSVSSYEPGG